MRIKFNDKIYRLKEVESGVDSLMELVEDPKYNHGDFVYEDGRIMIVNEFSIKRIVYHALIYPQFDLEVVYNDNYAAPIAVSSLNFRYATEEEKQLLIDAMKKDGKRWNAEMKCIEDIPKPKFKAGDKVKIKDGISSETHREVGPCFVGAMDKFIGKELTVKEYSSIEWVVFYEDDHRFQFAEDWLEPCSEEPKIGDWVIAWDNRNTPIIGVLDKINKDDSTYPYQVGGINWNHAVKWDGTKNHIEKVRRGEI